MQGVLLPHGHSEQMGPCPDCDGIGHIALTESAPAKTRDTAVERSVQYDHAQNLRRILKGEEVFSGKAWDYLRPLTAKGGGGFDTYSSGFNFGGFEKEGIARVFPYSTSIVGSRYRGTHQQSALRARNSGNRIIIVPEPANPCDPHALAVMVAEGTAQNGTAQNGFVWTHVGYVPRATAEQLAKVWPRFKGRLLVGEGRLIEHPRDKKNPKIVIEELFRNYRPG